MLWSCQDGLHDYACHTAALFSHIFTPLPHTCPYLLPQVIWRLQPSKDYRTAPVQWSRYSWRRGSVPLRWGVTLQGGGIGAAEIQIQPKATFKGSRK